jgi:hypothetical protein
MALVAAPQGGLIFRINPGNGSIVPCDPGGSGPAGLGALPFARYVCDWQALKIAQGSGKPVLFNTF